MPSDEFKIFVVFDRIMIRRIEGRGGEGEEKSAESNVKSPVFYISVDSTFQIRNFVTELTTSHGGN